MSEADKSSRRWFWLVAALAVLVIVVIYLSVAEDTIDVQITKQDSPLLPVSVDVVTVAPDTVEIKVYSPVRPRWSAQLRAAVSGKITQVHDSALAGQRVKEGTMLVSIEPSNYIAELSAAELSLKQAELDLLLAEKNTSVARAQFKKGASKPPNDLALHLPQLRLAKSAVASAQTRVAAHKIQLKNTTITAPFSGHIVERYVSPGQSVNPGDPLVDLVDDRRFEIIVEIGQKEWQLLRQPLTNLSARILNQQGTEIAQARIRQGGGFLDATTRQYRVFLEITNSAEAKVLSGDFVQVLLPGVTVPSALSIADSSLTQEGYIWYLDEQDRLQRHSPEVLFRRQDRVVIKAPGTENSWRIVVTPLVFFLPGQRVNPQIVEE
ncbi:MAG: efflux RND transporter periplasmic adaptor subunit [Candidatus Thiodiazotropha sp. (ex Ctena orbiculata)]|nr:efflux RND transporter periplasmic adaptor subunit [Candidatus Thiodiazotropha taylori]